MQEIVYENTPGLIAWAEAHILGVHFRPDAKAIGHARDGELTGVVVFDTFTTTDCLLAVASDGGHRFLSRAFIVHVFAYPFLQLGYKRVTSLISADNEPSIRLCSKIGFQREGTMRRASEKGEDLLVFGMLREECRWLRPSRKPARLAL
ncbi:hypothetical protein C8N35_11621 [Breoghania corrubedonensis]|uniref:RimJ/RimL family protein N-acetyltransferase n=1 Tax=Breoghania corrubedonensis TaxID=665038 RepID=A0A2T5UPY1_9HYPH|nr:GNAT family protein [Breoghania corrubedonensis]PTW53566.1 hypothetical protein C8N35_11621 [Breoghania corrubedonensis]